MPPEVMGQQMNQTTRRPTLLSVGMVLSFLFGSVAVFVALAAAAGLTDFSAVRNSPWGSWTLPVWGMANLIFGGLLVCVGVGLKMGRAWSRPLILAFWALAGVANIVSLVHHGRAELLWVPCLMFSVWYLYWRHNVVAYFVQSREA